MTGTQKQIEWAEKIKRVFDIGYDLINGKVSTEAQNILDELKKEDDSVFWINNKNQNTVVKLFKARTNELADELEDEYDDQDRDSYSEMEKLAKEVDGIFDNLYVEYYNANGNKSIYAQVA